MKNLSNINIKGLSKKLKIKGGLAMLGLATVMSVTACSPKTVNNNETTIEQTRNNDPFNKWIDNKTTIEETTIEEETTEKVTEETTTEEVTEEEISVLDVERFSKLVDEIMEENKELDFNVRKESIEALLYVCNMSMATPELSQLIESRFASEEEILNSVIETLLSYGTNMKETWYGHHSKHADFSKLFLDEIDRDAISYVQTGYDILANNINEKDIIDAPESELRELNSSIQAFMTEIINYSLLDGKINGYKKEELTSGASLGMYYLMDSGNLYLKTTGLVEMYSDEIYKIQTREDINVVLSQLYGELNVTLNSKSSLEECFEESTSHTK